MPTELNIDRFLRTALPEGWPRRGSVVYGTLAGDDAHRFAPDAERVYAFASTSGDERWDNTEPVGNPQGHRVLFLFTEHFSHCGEVHTNNGEFSRAILTTLGESMMDDTMREWQMRGVPALCRAEDGSCALIEQLVPLRDVRFHVSALNWLGAQSMHVLDAPASSLALWEDIARLSLEDEERFTEFASAKEMDLPKRAEWRTRLTTKESAKKRTTPREGRRMSAGAGRKKRVST